MEKLVSIVKAFASGDPGSLVLVIPRDAKPLCGARAGVKYQVFVDERRRLIYAPILAVEGK